MYYIVLCCNIVAVDRDWAADVRAQQYWLEETDRNTPLSQKYDIETAAEKILIVLSK